MSKLPFSAKFFITATYAAGALALLTIYFLLPPPDSRPRGLWWELVAFAALGIVGGSTKVRLLTRIRGNGETGSMTLGFALVFAAFLRFGASGALTVSLVSTLFSCLFPRQKPFQIVFNLAVSVLDTLAGVCVFFWLNNGALALHLPSLIAVIASSLTFFVINTGMIAVVIALCTQQNPLELWKESFLWASPSYFVGALLSTGVIALLGDHVLATLLCALPIGFLTYHSYKGYTDRAQALLESKEQLADLYLATIRSLALAIDAKDQYTHQHILRVQQYAVATARQMGVDGEQLKAIETGALLHDIGKLGVPEYVLLKPGSLTDEEFAKIKEHPRIGADILDPVQFPWPVTPMVKSHHERWDGTGYPDGLKGEEIPFTARILAVADAYDAMTSNRSYRNAFTHERAVEEVRQSAGKHFEPAVVEAFVAVIDGVVTQMAREGYGPLVSRHAPSSGASALPALAAAVTTPRSNEAVRDIQRASSELWALYEVAQTLSASLGLQDTLDILGRKLEAILPGTGCVFLLRGDGGANGKETTDDLIARTAVGVNQAFFQNCRTLSNDSRSVRVAQSRATYLGAFDPQDVMPQSQPAEAWIPIGTSLIVPIVHQGEVLGTINLYHPQENAFAPHDQYLLEKIAERAAMALYNGLLFDRTRGHALTDPLTGLANVRHFTQRVEERCGGGVSGKPFALLCLDLDSFKPINDNFGHQKGDKVLRDLGCLFEETVGRRDLVARYGGDEFLILLEDAGYEEAQIVARRIQDAVGCYNPGLRHPRLGVLRLGVSVGYACYPADGQDCARLLTVADAAMYEEKTDRKLGVLAQPSGGSGDDKEDTRGDKDPAAVVVRAARPPRGWRIGSEIRRARVSRPSRRRSQK